MKKYFLIVPVLFFSLLFLGEVGAQSAPEFLISWRAGNYVPDWYLGKSLPIAKTPIRVSFDLINNGKPVNLSGKTIRWHVNGDLAQNENDGLGLKSLTFAVADNPGKEMLVKISILDYAEFSLEKTIVIPVANPEAVIDSSYANNFVSSGSYIFNVNPFFFNANKSDLAVSWKINDIIADEEENNPWKLDLNLDGQAPSGFKIIISAFVKNARNILTESAGQSLTLYAK